MSTTLLEKNLSVAPADDERRQAAQAYDQLAPLLTGVAPLALRLPGGESAPIPISAQGALLDVLRQIAQGHAVTVLPVHAELTTQQAADFLHVSRPYLVKLLDEGQIPCHMVGTHRRIMLDDLAAFKREDDARRHAALNELTALSQELGLYDV